MDKIPKNIETKMKPVRSNCHKCRTKGSACRFKVDCDLTSPSSNVHEEVIFLCILRSWEREATPFYMV